MAFNWNFAQPNNGGQAAYDAYQQALQNQRNQMYTQNMSDRQAGNANDMMQWMQQGNDAQVYQQQQAALAQQQQEQAAMAKQKQVADIQSQISVLEKRIADNKARLSNWTGNADKIAAIEARKINVNDPTSIWRWKVDRDEARRIAKEQNKVNNSAKANALIEATNAIDSMIIDDRMDTPTKNAMLSKLADYKTLLQKNELPTKMVDDKIAELKGEKKQVIEESPESDKPEDFEFEGTNREQGEARTSRILQKNPESLTQNELATLKRDIVNGKISVSNETKNKIDKIYSQVIDRDKKRVEDQKREDALLKKGTNLTSDDLEFLKGRKGLKHHTNSYGDEWYTKG